MDKDYLLSLQRKVSQLRVEGKYKETLEACMELLDAGRMTNDAKSILTAQINMAASYYSIGDLEEAFASIDAHAEYSAVHGDDADRLNGFNVMFLLYEYNKDYIKAKDTLQKAIGLGEKLGHYNIVSNAYSNYSSVCAAEGNFKEALQYAQTGLEMAKLHIPRTPILEFRVKLNIGNAYIELGSIEYAEELIISMIKDPILEDFIREKTQCHDLYGRLLMKQKRYREAYDVFTTAKELAESTQDQNVLKDILEVRCRACELMEDMVLGFKAQQDYIALLRDIRQHEIAMTAVRLEVKHGVAMIEKRANTDALTGLYNRSYMESATDEMLMKAAAVGKTIVCIALDLDNLKILNDTYGHIFGDTVIKSIAIACSSQIRSNDIMGRFGGDEFAIIFNDMTIEEANRKALQLVQTVRDLKVEKDGTLISLSMSVGVASNRNGEIKSFEALFHDADMALYEAKQNGKNQIYVMN